jgi:hypothetical protein
MKPTLPVGRGLAIAAVIALVLAVSPGIAQPGPAPAGRPLAAPSPMAPSIPIQGRITDASGHELPDGPYSVTFQVFDADGTLLCSEMYPPPDFLYLEDGLFNARIDTCPESALDGRQLELQIIVEGETLSPRQPILASPYAWSLKPGAIIRNYGAGHALSLASGQSGSVNSALWAENTNATSGIGIWARAAGNDATVVIENAGTGALLKAFGADGGENEFRVDNDGLAQKTASGSPLTLTYQGDGRVTIQSPDAVARGVVVSLPVPAVLYGQPIEVESVAISCQTTDYYTNTYRVRLWRQDSDGTPSTLFDLSTWMCDTAAGYVFPITSLTNNMLDASNGALSLQFEMVFDSVSDSLTLNWVRLTLDTHDLY